jgi:glutathione S-transferase
MSLTLHFHPLASYCHKALIALYEHDAPFTSEARPSCARVLNEAEPYFAMFPREEHS